MSETLLDQIRQCIDTAAASYNPNESETPALMLWPDEGRQWQPIIDELRSSHSIIEHGDYDEALLQGPAYWIRCVVFGSIKPETLGEGLPIVYLPGVSRGDLRDAEHCPPALAPLVSLKHRALWFGHANGSDWTISALLQNKDRGAGSGGGRRRHNG